MTPLQQLIEGRLGEDLRKWVEAERGVTYPLPWRWVANELTRRTGTEVAAETVRLWAKDWGIE
jgi:hypothetical protein